MAWSTPEPGRLVGRGHPAGDFLEAWAWEVQAEEVGHLRVTAHLPDHVKNPRGQLFGGFTPTYVDLIALFTARAGPDRLAPRDRQRQWMATTSMHLDYFEPVMGPTFVLDSRLEKKRGRTHFVVTRFLQDGDLAVLAATTLRAVAIDRSLGDA
jgi:acyl-coenzyme A thioesterase PaaI-like protein